MSNTKLNMIFSMTENWFYLIIFNPFLPMVVSHPLYLRTLYSQHKSSNR